MIDWTPERVRDRLTEAADVLKRLPAERVQGYFNLWPEVVHDFADLVGQSPEPMRLPPPPPAAITCMEETLDWVKFLAPDDARLVWARAEGAPWKAICWRFGVARATAHRRWQYGLAVIVLRLNGRPVPMKRSQAFVIERASRQSRTNAQ
jgi:hypothetical protein